MHSNPVALLLLACLLIPTLALPARTAGKAHDAAVREGSLDPPGDREDLADCMENMKEHLKGIAMALQAQDSEAALEHVAELQGFVMKAKLLAPANLREVPRKEREAHRKQFRAELAGVLAELARLEVDLLEGRPEAAFARITGPLYEMRNGAHERYQAAE